MVTRSEAERIGRLREQLAKSEDLSKVMSLFLDQLGSDPSFMERGAPTEDPALVGYVGKIVEELLDPPPSFARLFLLERREHAMKHGLVHCEGWAGVVVFFDDLGQGMLALTDAARRGPTLYCRFTRFSREKAACARSN